MPTLTPEKIAELRLLRGLGLSRTEVAETANVSPASVDKYAPAVHAVAPVDKYAPAVAAVPTVATTDDGDAAAAGPVGHPGEPGLWPDRFDAACWYDGAHPFQWNQDGPNPFSGMDVEEFADAISDAADTVEELAPRLETDDLTPHEAGRLAEARWLLAEADRIGDHGCSTWACDCVSLAAQSQIEALDSTLDYLAARHPDKTWIKVGDPTRCYDIADGVEYLDVAADDDGFYDAVLHADGRLEVGGEDFEPVPAVFGHVAANVLLDDEQGENALFALEQGEAAVSELLGDLDADDLYDCLATAPSEIVSLARFHADVAGTGQGAVLSYAGFHGLRGLQRAADGYAAPGTAEFDELAAFVASRAVSAGDLDEYEPATVRSLARFHARATADPATGPAVAQLWPLAFENLHDATGGDPAKVADHL